MILRNAIFISTLLLLFTFNKLNAQSLWKPVGIGQGITTSATVSCLYNDTIDDLLYMGGFFTKVDNLDSAYAIAVWDGTNWNRLKMGVTNSVYAITRYQNKIYVGGGFQSADGFQIPAAYLATWDGIQWDTLPGGKLNNVVYNFEIYNNELYVMGGFDSIGTMEANGIAKWNGVTWSAVYNLPKLNSPNPNLVYDMKVYQGNIYVAGNFDATINIEDITMYNGVSWQSVGPPPGMYGSLNAVANMEVYNNELYVVGDIRKVDGNAGNFIQKWDGLQWYDVGGGVSFEVWDIREYNNELYIAGNFDYAANGLVKASKIAKWDGLQWCGLRDSIDNTITSIEFYHDTLIVAGGFWTLGGDTIHKIAQWNGGNYTDTCNVYVGINDIENFNNEVSIYPNPTTGSFIIDIGNFKQANLEIYNLSGQLILQKLFVDNTTQVNLTNYPKGLYLVKIIADNKVIIEKIVYQ